MTVPRPNPLPGSGLLLVAVIAGLLAAGLLQIIFHAQARPSEVRVTFDAAGAPVDAPAQPLFPGLPPAS